MNERVAAVIVEPVQGEGGVQMPPPGYLQALSGLCREHGALFIADEVQTGFCRTGSFFAVDAAGVSPDILSMGKGIAGGFPFAAFAMSDAVAAKVQKGDHGGTYCGNPLGCAVAEAVLDYLQANKIADRALAMGAQILQRLATLPKQFPEQISVLRGRGLLIGIQMHSDAQVAALTAACLEHGLIVTPTRNGVLRLIPSLLVSAQEVDEAIGLLHSALSKLQNEYAQLTTARSA
jgi:acetylornithine/N-succinyldiaminopimelate aminotransferase